MRVTFRRSMVTALAACAALALSASACDESPVGPGEAPLEVRVGADTIVAALNDWGPSRTVSFVTRIELTNHSASEDVEYDVCGSIALHRGSGELAYGLACPAIYLPPLVLAPGATTTLDLGHQLCVDGICGEGRPVEELEGLYEVRVRYVVRRASQGAGAVVPTVTSRSNSFVVLATP